MIGVIWNFATMCSLPHADLMEFAGWLEGGGRCMGEEFSDGFGDG